MVGPLVCVALASGGAQAIANVLQSDNGARTKRLPENER